MLSGSASFKIPPGQHPPFATVTDTDHKAYIFISAIVGLLYSVVFVGFRIFLRNQTKQKWQREDTPFAFATVCFESDHHLAIR